MDEKKPLISALWQILALRSFYFNLVELPGCAIERATIGLLPLQILYSVVDAVNATAAASDAEMIITE